MKHLGLERAATLVMAGCALVITCLVAGRVLAPRPPEHPARRGPERVNDWRAYAAVGHRLGPANAKVTITEFSDFQCPFCRRLFAVLDTVRSRHPADIAIVYRHFPLDKLHRFARPAALASECAGAQGAFEPFHDILFREPDSLGRAAWSEVARRAGVSDTTRFAKCLRDSVFAPTVKVDIDAGTRLGVTGTPSVMVNQWRFFGTPSVHTLDSTVVSELRELSHP